MKKIACLTIVLALCGCGEPASKQNSSPNNGGTNNVGSNNTSTNNTSSNSASNNVSTNNVSSNNASNNTSTSNGTLGGPGDPCEEGNGCQEGLRCQSAEERAWNFCGAPMEPDCAETEVGDSCGNCFIACGEDADCDGQTCNGTYCIGPRTCAAEQQPPP